MGLILHIALRQTLRRLWEPVLLLPVLCLFWEERSGTSEEVKHVSPEMTLHTTVPRHHCSILLKFEGCGLNREEKRSFIATLRMLEVFQEKVQLRSKRS